MNYRPPRFLIFYPTSVCNMRCRHCFYHQELGKGAGQELSLDQIATLSRQLGRVKILWLGGGEPLLRNDLPQILELFYKKNLVSMLSIPTNGWDTSLITTQLIKILKISGRRKISIVVSLDGDESSHNNLRGSDSFSRAITTIKALRDLRNKYPTLRVRINTTLGKHNLDGVKNLLPLANDLLEGVNAFNLSLLRDGSLDKFLSLPSKQDCYNLWLEKKKFFKEKKNIIAEILENAAFKLALQTAFSRKRSFSCQAGCSMGVVFEDGRVGFCETLPSIGNIKEASFSQIWNSELARKQRELVKRKQCVCWNDCFFLVNFIRSPGLLIRWWVGSRKQS